MRCSHTVVAKIGFRFLYFDYSARTAAKEAFSQIDISAWQGGYTRLRKWQNDKAAPHVPVRYEVDFGWKATELEIITLRRPSSPKRD